MFNTLKQVSARKALLAAAFFATATSAFAQAPTDAQKSAIRSACRSDFMAHCSSVTPGGAEAFQCLQKNMSSLSSGCQTAVRAIAPPAAPKAEPAAAPKTEAAPKAEPAPAPAAPKAESAPAAKPAAAAPAPKAAAPKQPSSAQLAAIKSLVPRRLSQGLRQRAAGRRACARMPGEEQGQGLAGLREGRERRNRRRRGSYRSPVCRRRSGARRSTDRARVAPDAAARRTVRCSLGLWRRHPHGLRRRRGRCRPHHAMPRQQCRVAFSGLQGRAGAVRGAIATRANARIDQGRAHEFSHA